MKNTAKLSSFHLIGTSSFALPALLLFRFSKQNGFHWKRIHLETIWRQNNKIRWLARILLLRLMIFESESKKSKDLCSLEPAAWWYSCQRFFIFIRRRRRVVYSLLLTFLHIFDVFTFWYFWNVINYSSK